MVFERPTDLDWGVRVLSEMTPKGSGVLAFFFDLSPLDASRFLPNNLKSKHNTNLGRVFSKLNQSVLCVGKVKDLALPAHSVSVQNWKN